jgi:NDP-sugar pyrophosphorylase family protein
VVKTTINVILLCGGKGSRLIDVTKDEIPKSLYAIDDMELIRYSVNMLESSPLVDKLIFAVDHHADKMVQWIYDQELQTEVVVSQQNTPGVVAAVKSALPHVTSQHVIVCNTDEIRDEFDVGYFIKNSLQLINAAEGVMATTSADNLYRHRVIQVDGSNRITATTLKGDIYRKSPDLEGQINIGFLLLPRQTLINIDERYGNDWSSIIDPLVEQRKLYTVFSKGVRYFNVGTALELEEAMKFYS